MSLKLSFEIQGLRDEEPVTVSVSGNGHEFVDGSKPRESRLLDDPAEIGGQRDPDDPGSHSGGVYFDDSWHCDPRPLNVSQLNGRDQRHSGFIIVSLSPFVPITRDDDLFQLARDLGLGGLKQGR